MEVSTSKQCSSRAEKRKACQLELAEIKPSLSQLPDLGLKKLQNPNAACGLFITLISQMVLVALIVQVHATSKAKAFMEEEAIDISCYNSWFCNWLVIIPFLLL